ncbi:Osmotically-inducible protein OsmY, contains BON domain [Abditibacterium utsteinense]|uniref:Osmotically-inducible protein OsmY, contains BON domain n=1 Tax=Abditibacterium utsteinense TaxID=1960156 RepID=A0A2S8SXG7_9BACT|nr:BON domain-containing protein [Abditibacterium utsteinense]PQV65458.1 Osmotically-inducible protein OsmY, contains BON domain [Abditibacterium utsteinense]
MNNIRKMGALLGAGAVIFSLAGCADKNGNGQAETPMSANNVDGAVKDNLADTANAVSSAGSAVGNAVTGAAGAVGDAATGAAKTVGNAGETAAMTSKVKTAIGANPGLKGSNINVSTMADKNSISLTGTVTSAAQKTLANAIAKKNAPGYKVVDQLKMGSANKM